MSLASGSLASDPGGRLVYAGRGGTGIDTAELTEVTKGGSISPTEF
jgi:hypothetical protein